MYRRMTAIMTLCKLFTACGGIFNPYKSEFDCPMRDKGQCVSVPEAYDESIIRTSQEATRHAQKKSDTSKTGDDREQQFDPKDIYQQEMAKKLTAYIRQPSTPFLAPPTVMRALILPYKASAKDLYSERHIYIIVDEPQWVMSAPAYGGDSRDMILEKTETKAKK
ncbi:MAG: type IV conjugative transfer system lipoprotein TraV [Syntrophaceae bacterium]